VKWGENNVAFLTLTFADKVRCPKTAQKRWHSLRTHIIKKRYLDYLLVFERTEKGYIHYHVLVALDFDARTGFNFDLYLRLRASKSRNSHLWSTLTPRGGRLSQEWAFWRDKAPRYQFGRTEMLPIRSTAEAVGRYLGGYIAKHLAFRQSRDKRVRLVRYKAGGARTHYPGKSATTGRAWLWRRKVRAFASMLGLRKDLEALRSRLGKRWAYRYRTQIMAVRLPDDTAYPNFYTKLLDRALRGEEKYLDDDCPSVDEYIKCRNRIIHNVPRTKQLEVCDKHSDGTEPF
jgi:hypothetical protein